MGFHGKGHESPNLVAMLPKGLTFSIEAWCNNDNQTVITFPKASPDRTLGYLNRYGEGEKK